MPFCGSCGKHFDDNRKFCPFCGTLNDLLKTEMPDQPAQAPALQTVKRDTGPYGAYRLEDLPEGFVIDDRYEVKEKLGQGGFGAVYRTYDRQMDIEKALKVIPESVSSDREALGDLRNEAKTMVSLNNENIVRVYDFHSNGPITYIDMEYVDGISLSDVKLDSPGKKLPEKRVKDLGTSIARGLSYAHKKNVIHRDIKPQNIMVNRAGQVKIMDFGISETVRTSMSRLANSSSSGTLVYMAPEQVKGKDIGPEADIYAFGATMYELLSGHPPFWKGAIEYQIFNEKPKPLEGVSDEMNALVLKCLEKDYRDRFRNFTEVEAGLNGKQMHRPTTIDKVSESTAVVKEYPNRLHATLAKRDMVLVEGGTFRMGSTDGDDDEEPVHIVTVSSFYLSKYEVTQGLWKVVMENNKFEKCTGIGDSNPVNMVSWYGVLNFCNKLSKWDGLEPAYLISGTNVTCDWSKNGYRLPTEAEWEYAARGGNESRGYIYSGSNSIGEVAWYDDNSGYETHPVGQKKPNELGLYDMSGNVLEWCWDRYGNYSIDSQRDPRGASSGSRRIRRGGGWCYDASGCRAAYRDFSSPSGTGSRLGFRLARSAVQ